MAFNQDLLDEIVKEEFVLLAIRHFPEEGGQAIRAIMTALIDVYNSVELDSVRGPIIVFRQTDASKPDLTGEARDLKSFADLQYMTNEGFTIELGDYPPRLWPAQDKALCEKLSEQAVVYLWDGSDTLWAGGESKQPSYIAGLLSLFQRPVFNDLNEALEHYRLHFVRTSRCKLFQKAWADDRRLFFHPGPEDTLRDSLEQHLASTLRDVEVRPEHIVDESHQVDLRVLFGFSNRNALIEIKWLGKSRAEDGKITAAHPAARARSGAKQLADYLDWNRPRAPTIITKGYLVVIDARRRGLTKDSESVSRQDGLHYADQDITYDPPYHENRDDFEPPTRMFAEPICS